MSFMAGTSIARHFYLFSATLRTNYEKNEENLIKLIRSDLLKAYSFVVFRPICFICANRQLVKQREE